MKRVVVTDGEQRSTLAVVRSLGRSGYRVEVTSTSGSSLSGASRFASADHIVPDPQGDPVGYQEAVCSLARARGADFLIPMTDVAATLCLETRDRIGRCVIPFPDRDAWNLASDKARLVDLAHELGVPTPRGLLVETPTDDLTGALAFAVEEGYPIVVKPHRSAVVTPRGVEKVTVRLVQHEVALRTVLATLPAEAFPVLLQQRIEGPGLGAFFLMSGGNRVAAFAHRRLREKPPSGGVSVFRESAVLREDIELFSEKLLSRLAWSGVAMVEFKEDARTGVPYLMEINGRFWGSLQLAIDAGVDFPRLLLRSFGDTRGAAHESASPSYAIGVRSRWLWGDVDHLIAVMRSPGTDPEGRSRVRAILSFLTPGGSREKTEVARFGDRGPFFRETVEWVRALRLRGL